MKKSLFLTLILITIVTFAFLPRCFAQVDVPVVVIEEESPRNVDLDTAPANVVRLIYLLPNDREAQPDIDMNLDASIKMSQQFFADEMERHGYGRKTFRFEANDDGNVIVHHVDGKHNDTFYQTDSFNKIFDELEGHFDFANNIYVIAVEISSGNFNGTVCGIAGNDENGGYVLIPASGHCTDNVALIPHELGHAFGLQHYFLNAADIMSYGASRENLSSKQLSLCNAQWLSVHPYFNSDKVITRNLNTSIHPLSAGFDVKPPHAFRLRFELIDPDGLHQAQLIASKSAALNESSEPEFIDCQVLSGVSANAEFATTRLLDYVMIQVIDKEGNYTRRFFKVDSTLGPPLETDAVIIPDKNLATAIRQALTIQPTQHITTFDMVRLQSLKAVNRGITNLTGLEHALALESLDLTGNQIQDLTPISALTLLRTLLLNGNAIGDLTPISKLTQLTELRIGGNQIRDLMPLSNLTQLTVLVLTGNHISDLTPLSNLTQLIALAFDNPFFFDLIDEDIKPVPGLNEISDITPLSNLTQLKQLGLTGNRVQDLTPLTNLTQLYYLGLGYNQIRDITPLKNLIYLDNLVLQHNQISDIRPLKGLVLLRLLYLDSNPLIDELTGIEDLTALRQLQISDNPITDITPLTRLTQLIELSLHQCQISDITPLADMTQLRALSAYSNQITDITPLSRLTQLYELAVSECQISDISPLANLTQLEALSAYSNQITDITPLASLTKLTSLHLYNNQISDITTLSRLTKLEKLTLYNNQISDVRPLVGLGKLSFLRIWDNPITDLGPLLTLLRRNPGIRILHRKDGKPLPVTLSSFKAERTADGVVINWTTESELNNAGFNILRSNTRTGVFQKVNSKLIKGAGTKGERSTYTWTDTSARPNTIYYYQIEDVSYAGVHKTLMTTRLRGLVSAKGKMITRWAHYKSRQ